MEGERRKPKIRALNQALTRPETVAGAEKKPLGYVVAAGIMFAMFGWIYLSAPAALASAANLFGGVPLLRRLAKHDPQLFAIYRANLPYKQRYSARASARAKPARRKG